MPCYRGESFVLDTRFPFDQCDDEVERKRVFVVSVRNLFTVMGWELAYVTCLLGGTSRGMGQ